MSRRSRFPSRTSTHVGELGLDCRYCHSFVEVSGHANVPTNQTCYNCHGPDTRPDQEGEREARAGARGREDGRADPVDQGSQGARLRLFQSQRAREPRRLLRRAATVRSTKWKSCRHAEPHSMGWCLDCHRNAGEEPASARPGHESELQAGRPRSEGVLRQARPRRAGSSRIRSRRRRRNTAPK